MTLAIMTTKLDRKTGKKITEEVHECKSKVNESKVYGPLVEILYKNFKQWEGGQAENQSNAS